MIYGRELPGCPYNLKARLTRAIVGGRRVILGGPLRRWSDHAPLDVDYSGKEANEAIKKILADSVPRFLARFGATEMEAIIRGLDRAAPGNRFLRICAGKSGPFWWDNSIRASMSWNSGFFTVTDEALDRFAKMACEDSREIDLLLSWIPGEKRLKRLCFPTAKSIPLGNAVPFWHDEPWTKSLEGKKVLAVHNAAKTIAMQYPKRKRLFANPGMLPDFDLKVYKCVMSACGAKPPFKTWFDALERMKEDISKIDFDVALIAGGAYGMCIGAFVKRDLGRTALHLGGMMQLLFGIKGRRWDSDPRYSGGLYNEHWTRVLDEERPENFNTLEGGYYW